MKKIGIIGAGNMGTGIVQKTAQEGLSVVMMDIKPEFIERGLDNIKSTLQEAVDRKILRSEQVDEIFGRIKGTTDINDVKDCDLVIEAVFEDMKVKSDLFKKLDEVCDSKTILGTNTSSFSVDELAKSTNRPERFVGLHFFYHPAKNRLLEIIPGKETSEETMAACSQYAQLTAKTDILVKDAPGFAVNRFFIPWYVEAIRILEEGWTNIPTIDEAAMKAFGIGMGPFKLMNVTGVPIALHSSNTLGEELGPFYAPPDSLKEQVESGEFWPLEGEVETDKLDKIADRLSAIAFYVATCLIEEGVSDMTDIDVGAKVGLRWRRGPFEMMNNVGIEKSYAEVEDLLKAWPDIKIPETLKNQKGAGTPWDIRYVKYIKDGILGHVLISRPDAMNALNGTVVKQIDEVFKEAEADPDTKAIVLEGSGKAFVAGADIKFFIDCIKQDRLQDNLEFTTFGQEVLNRIDDSKKQVIAKMDGLALGGGLELALSADVIVATPKAVMGFPETGIGIYPGLGGTQRTSRYIGKELAKYLIFTGRIISARDAMAIGLADYLFASDEVDEKIKTLVSQEKLSPSKGKEDNELPEDWRKLKDLFADANIDSWLTGKYLDDQDPLASKTAKMIATKAPISLKVSNQLVDEGFELPLKDGLKLELDQNIKMFSTKDALIGLTNVGKRDIPFEGK